MAIALSRKNVSDTFFRTCAPVGREKTTVGLRAAVRESQLGIEFWDDGAGIGDGPSDSGFGLSGTKERLELLFDDVAFEVGPRAPRGTVIRIRIPFRPCRSSTEEAR